MAARRVKLPDLNAAIADILEEYGDNVNEAKKHAVKEVAEIARKETKEGSPVRRSKNLRRGKYKPGAYKASWSVRENHESRLRSEAVVYNKKHYQIAHLLEKGHRLVQHGKLRGYVQPIPHIRKAEEHAVKNLEEALKKIAQG